MITEKKITEAVVELIRIAETDLPKDVEFALRKAYIAEKKKIARIQLKSILGNIKFARKNSIPLCQDTGLINFYVRIGSRADVDLRIINNSLINGVKIATREIPLRPNAVHPLTRVNSKDNTGIRIPNIGIEILPGKGYIEITILPKGAGSENVSKMAMLKPSDGIEGIRKFVVETVANAGGMPCPPTIVGVGIGGSSDIAARLAKKALLRKIGLFDSKAVEAPTRSVGLRNKDKKISRLEENLLKEINKLGIGPMGLGGRTTCLSVNIEYAYCHTASLPVAVNLGCWANRYATIRIR